MTLIGFNKFGLVVSFLYFELCSPEKKEEEEKREKAQLERAAETVVKERLRERVTSKASDER